MFTKRLLLLASIASAAFDIISTWLLFTFSPYGTSTEANIFLRYLLIPAFGNIAPLVYLPFEALLIFALSVFYRGLGSRWFPLLPSAIVTSFAIMNLLALIFGPIVLILFNGI